MSQFEVCFLRRCFKDMWFHVAWLSSEVLYDHLPSVTQRLHRTPQPAIVCSREALDTFFLFAVIVIDSVGKDWFYHFYRDGRHRCSHRRAMGEGDPRRGGQTLNLAQWDLSRKLPPTPRLSSLVVGRSGGWPHSSGPLWVLVDCC